MPTKQRSQQKPTQQSQRRPKRRLPGWVSNQHGAWAMVIVPPIVALTLAPSWTGALLALTWWFGYFFFFAASVWMRARFRRKHLPPVATYGAITAVLGIGTLFADWTLLRWLPLYAPLIAIAVYETWRRRPRSLLSGLSTVLAANLILPTIVSASEPLTSTVWATTAVLAAFFVGTLPYVKTLIRERGSKAWVTGSVAFHAAALVLVCLLTFWGLAHWLTIPTFAVLLVRAWGMPWYAARNNMRWSPQTVGMFEGVFTALVAVTALLTPLG